MTGTVKFEELCINPPKATMLVHFSVGVKVEGQCNRTFTIAIGQERLIYSNPKYGKVDAQFGFKQTFSSGIHGWILPKMTGYARVSTNPSKNGGGVNKPTVEKDISATASMNGELNVGIVGSLGPNFPNVGQFQLASMGTYGEAASNGGVTINRHGKGKVSYGAKGKVYVQISAGANVGVSGSMGLCGVNIGFKAGIPAFGTRINVFQRNL